MSGVRPDEPIVLHQYRDFEPGSFVRLPETLCGGIWYPTGEAPCEVNEAQRAERIAALPPCDAADLEAAARLLGIDKVSRCWTRDAASWQYVAPTPDSPAMAQLMRDITALNAGLVSAGSVAAKSFIVHPSYFDEELG